MASQEEDKRECRSNINNEQESNFINVYKKYESILNSKSEPLETKIEALIHVWNSIGQCNLTDSDSRFVVHIIDWAKLHTLNVVLTGEWKKYKDDYEAKLVKELSETQAELRRANRLYSARCQKLTDVIRNPWSHPILDKLLKTPNAEVGRKEIEFFCMETAYLVSVRLKKLCESHCEDLALNLVSAYMKCYNISEMENLSLNATDTQIWFIFDMYVMLLHKFKKLSVLLSLLKGITLDEGLSLIKRFYKKQVKISKVWKNSSRVAHLASQIFITSAVMKPIEESGEVLENMLNVWLEYNNDEKVFDDLCRVIRRIINAAECASHIYVFADCVHKKIGLALKTLIIELYVRALTTDMNDLEICKEEKNDEKAKAITERLGTGFCKLGDVVDDNVKVARECVLTAFSVYPTVERLRRIEDLARRSGLKVLDTGQNWKCRLHPPALPTDDLAWKCNVCNDWMVKPALNVPLNTNLALHEALTAENLGLSSQLCDDLVVVLSCPRYQLLSWLVNWNDLHRLCIMYVNDPEITKNIVTDLKFLEIDYSQFRHIKVEPCDEDEMFGVEKGYEVYLDANYSDEPVAAEESSDDDLPQDCRFSLESNAKENTNMISALLPPPPAKSDPKTLKSLRMFRPNLKRSRTNQGESSVPEKILKAENSKSLSLLRQTIINPPIGVDGIFNLGYMQQIPSLLDATHYQQYQTAMHLDGSPGHQSSSSVSGHLSSSFEHGVNNTNIQSLPFDLSMPNIPDLKNCRASLLSVGGVQLVKEKNRPLVKSSHITNSITEMTETSYLPMQNPKESPFVKIKLSVQNKPLPKRLSLIEASQILTADKTIQAKIRKKHLPHKKRISRSSNTLNRIISRLPLGLHPSMFLKKEQHPRIQPSKMLLEEGKLAFPEEVNLVKPPEPLDDPTDSTQTIKSRLAQIARFRIGKKSQSVSAIPEIRNLYGPPQTNQKKLSIDCGIRKESTVIVSNTPDAVKFNNSKESVSSMQTEQSCLAHPNTSNPTLGNVCPQSESHCENKDAVITHTSFINSKDAFKIQLFSPVIKGQDGTVSNMKPFDIAVMKTNSQNSSDEIAINIRTIKVEPFDDNFDLNEIIESKNINISKNYNCAVNIDGTEKSENTHDKQSNCDNKIVEGLGDRLSCYLDKNFVTSERSSSVIASSTPLVTDCGKNVNNNVPSQACVNKYTGKRRISPPAVKKASNKASKSVKDKKVSNTSKESNVVSNPAKFCEKLKMQTTVILKRLPLSPKRLVVLCEKTDVESLRLFNNDRSHVQDKLVVSSQKNKTSASKIPIFNERRSISASPAKKITQSSLGLCDPSLLVSRSPNAVRKFYSNKSHGNQCNKKSRIETASPTSYNKANSCSGKTNVFKVPNNCQTDKDCKSPKTSNPLDGHAGKKNSDPVGTSVKHETRSVTSAPTNRPPPEIQQQNSGSAPPCSKPVAKVNTGGEAFVEWLSSRSESISSHPEISPPHLPSLDREEILTDALIPNCIPKPTINGIPNMHTKVVEKSKSKEARNNGIAKKTEETRGIARSMGRHEKKGSSLRQHLNEARNSVARRKVLDRIRIRKYQRTLSNQTLEDLVAKCECIKKKIAKTAGRVNKKSYSGANGIRKDSHRDTNHTKNGGNVFNNSEISIRKTGNKETALNKCSMRGKQSTFKYVSFLNPYFRLKAAYKRRLKWGRAIKKRKVTDFRPETNEREELSVSEPQDSLTESKIDVNTHLSIKVSTAFQQCVSPVLQLKTLMSPKVTKKRLMRRKSENDNNSRAPKRVQKYQLSPLQDINPRIPTTEASMVTVKSKKYDTDKGDPAFHPTVSVLTGLDMMQPSNVDHIVNVVQIPGGCQTSTITSQNSQTSTQVSPHIQRIGQPRVDKPESIANSDSNTGVTGTTATNSTTSKPSTSQSSTLKNILSQNIKPTQSNCVRRPAPMINILSHHLLKPAINATVQRQPAANTVSSQESLVNNTTKSVTTSEQTGATTVNVNKNTVTTVKNVVTTPTSGQGTILQLICKSTLPKFQQAFGKSVYQNNTESVEATSTSGETPTSSADTSKKTTVKNSTVNIQPIQGGVIYTRQMPVGQTINLLPPGRGQVFRIATSNSDQISLVKDTVIHSKMSALLAAALQGKQKNSESQSDSETNSEEPAPRGAVAARPTLLQNTRIVKPVLQIPSNVIRTSPQSNLSSTTLEQLREFDMVYKQIKERSSTGTPAESNASNDSTEAPQRISVTYLNQQGQKYTQFSPVVVVSSYCNLQPAASPALSVTSQGSSSPCVTPAPTPTMPKVSSKSSKGKTVKNTTTHTSKASPIPKPQQKPQEDEHTTQRIFDILAEYAEQLRNSPDLNNKPAPRRRSNPPTNPSQNSKRKKSSGSKKTGQCSSIVSDADLEDHRTVGSEDSSCGVVQLSVQEEEQQQLQSTTESNDSNSSSRQQLILTEASNSQTRNLIIAESSVGEALKMPNTAVLVPGNYIMPVSMVKGGQQIAVVSGGSKILATVPARSGPNMLLFQSFLNQNKKTGVPTVKYSTIQPISGISPQNISNVNAQPPVILPPNSHSLTAVTLGQPITLKKIDESDRVNTELLLTISQPRDNCNSAGSDSQQPDSSSSAASNVDNVEIEETIIQSDQTFQKTYINAPIATPVIAQASCNKDDVCIKDEINGSQTGTLITLNLADNKKDENVKSGERVQSVLVTACTSNGPMLSHTPPRYRKPENSGINHDISNKEEYMHNGEKQNNNETKNFQSNASYYPKVKKPAPPQKLERELLQLSLQRKQAALERELRLQKSLSEECEDLGVDEPSTSDLFPEADLLFDSNHSPSFDQCSQDLVKKGQDKEEPPKASMTLFSDDEDDDNSGSLRTDFLFEPVEYQTTEAELEYDRQQQLTNGQSSTSNESGSSCEDNTLLQNCASMSDVTLNSPISCEYDSNAMHKYKFKYSNRKKGERAKQNVQETWTAEVSSSEDTMGSTELGKVSGLQSHTASCDEDLSDGSYKVVHVAISKSDLLKDGESCEELHCDEVECLSGRGARRSVKKQCSCCNGQEDSARKRPASRPQTPAPHKKAFISKKR